MDLLAVNTMSRLNTGTTIVNMPDATLLTIDNVTYRELINVIVTKVNEDFFYDEWVWSTVLGQREYTFPIRDASTNWLKKLINVGIKYTSITDHISLTPTKFSNLVRNPTYYEDSQPNTAPFYTVADKSYFIYPVPTESVTWGILLYWVSDPKELIDWASEADIKIPLDYHHLMVLGNEYKIFKALRQEDKAIRAKNAFDIEVNRMVSELSDRIIKPLESEMPFLTNLE